jgi:hypothetical protein
MAYFTPYIPSFPAEEATYLETQMLGIIVGQHLPDGRKALHAAVNLADYAAGQIYPDTGTPSAAPAATSAMALGRKSFHLALKDALANQSAVNWQQLLLSLLESVIPVILMSL